MPDNHSLVEKAARLAVTAHATQTRKTDGSPYVVHPMMAAYMLVRHHFSDTVIAAALTHDVIEDTSVTEEELRSELGDAVADIVLAVSEDKTLEWRARKEKYIESVRHGPEEVRAVSIADKLHNTESRLVEKRAGGSDLWKQFTRGEEEQKWLAEATLSMFKETWQHPLVDEYERAVRELFDTH